METLKNGISHNYKLREIGENLLVDPTNVSKEVKRNRIKTSVGLKNDCKRTKKWPYVCTGCKNRYNNCPYTKYKYNASKAQENADTNLINSRRWINVDDEEFKRLDKIIKDDVDDNKSIYQIKIETTGHTYIDYLAYLHKHPVIYVWQLDFLRKIKTNNNNILSLVLPDLQFILLDLIKKPNQQKVVEYFDELEERIGTNAFIELVPVILTDRDPNFIDMKGICFSKITGEERCKLFFYDPDESIFDKLF